MKNVTKNYYDSKKIYHLLLPYEDSMGGDNDLEIELVS